MRPSGWWFAVVPALTLIVGLVLGGLIVGVAGDDPAADPSPTDAPTTPEASPSGDVTVAVPQECVAAADTVQQATGLIRDGVAAVRDFRPEELIDLINELEDLEALAREQAAACSAVDVSQSP